MLMHLTERDEPLLTFVPQHESHTPETLKQRKPANAVKFRVVAQHERQSVTGDSAAQMMNVMNPNIGREPAQQAWQGVVRAAVKRRITPILFGGAFEELSLTCKTCGLTKKIRVERN